MRESESLYRLALQELVDAGDAYVDSVSSGLRLHYAIDNAKTLLANEEPSETDVIRDRLEDQHLAEQIEERLKLMREKLSILGPAAQAVLDAMYRSCDHDETRRLIAAEILRAVADQVVPVPPCMDSCCEYRQLGVRNEILAIADDLCPEVTPDAEAPADG